MVSSVRFTTQDVGYAAIVFGGTKRDFNGDGVLVLHRSDLGEMSANALRLALESAEQQGYGPASDSVLISSVPIEYFDNDYSPVEPFDVSFNGSSIQMRLQFESDLDDEEESYAYLAELVSPLLTRHRLKVFSVGLDPDFVGGPPWMLQMVVTAPTRARSMKSLADAAEDVLALLGAVISGDFTAGTLATLIESGHAEVLIGQHENHWLEVKADEYPLQTFAGRVAFAEVIAGMANGGVEGLVVIGMRTRSTAAGGEIIKDVTPLRIDPKSLRRHRAAVRNHVFPAVSGIAIREAAFKEGRILLVQVPAQAEELKPFLVHGTTIEGHSRGAFFGISTRSVDENVPLTAPMVHATLAAGRALLRPDGELTVIRREDLRDLEQRLGRDPRS